MFIQLIKNVLGFNLITDDILSIHLGIEYWTLQIHIISKLISSREKVHDIPINPDRTLGSLSTKVHFRNLAASSKACGHALMTTNYDN